MFSAGDAGPRRSNSLRAGNGIGRTLLIVLGAASLLATATGSAQAAAKKREATAADVTAPVTIFGTTVPATPASSDTDSVEVGVKFMSSKAGYITGLRFYKGTTNTGTHSGTLWSSTG